MHEKQLEDDHKIVATKPHHHPRSFVCSPSSCSFLPAPALAWRCAKGRRSMSIWVGRRSWRAGLLRRSCWSLPWSVLSASACLTHPLSMHAGWFIWSDIDISLIWRIYDLSKRADQPPYQSSQVGHPVCGRCWRSLSDRCPVCLNPYNRWVGPIAGCSFLLVSEYHCS